MLQQQIDNDIRESLKSGDSLRTSTLRGLKNEISNAALRKGNISTPLSDPEVIQIIRKQITQREESAQMFNKGGRIEDAIKEVNEASILAKYLPEPLQQTEVEEIVAHAITELKATTLKDMGAVMKLVTERIAGRADGKRVSGLVRMQLTDSA